MNTPGPGGARPTRAAQVLRLPVLVVVPVVLLAAALAAGLAGRASVPEAPPVLASVVAPASSQSASWYCTGGGSTGPETATLDLVNTSGRTVTGTVDTVNSAGKRGSQAVSVPAYGQATDSPGAAVSGAWEGSTVDLHAGGVAVTEVVNGSPGWSQSPCATSAMTQWYLPVGSTTSGNTLTVSLYNPTSATAVADLTFLTPGGARHPQAFQGIVVPSGAVVTENVGSLVQDDAEVATEVSVHSGQLVAAELDRRGQSGQSIQLGAPSLSSHWNLGRSENVVFGSVQLFAANPGGSPEHMTVSVQLPTGPLRPVRVTIQPASVTDVDLSGLPGAPLQTGYLTRVTASGGAGVVVGEAVQVPGGSGSWGSSLGTDEVTARQVSQWLLLGPPAAVTGSSTKNLTIAAPLDHSVTAEISPLGVSSSGGKGSRRVSSGSRAPATLPTATRSSRHLVSVPAGGSLTIVPSDTAAPLTVSGSQGAAVSEDLGPGQVTLGAVALGS